MYKLGCKETEELGIKLPTSFGLWRKQGSPRKNIYSCFIDYTKAFHCVNHNKLWKTVKGMGIPDHLTCLLRNMYVGQEATVRTRQRKTGQFKTIVTLFIYLIWREHHAKCWAGWITTWNQDCWEKYQPPQICRRYHSNGRKWRETTETLDDGEREE